MNKLDAIQHAKNHGATHIVELRGGSFRAYRPSRTHLLTNLLPGATAQESGMFRYAMLHYTHLSAGEYLPEAGWELCGGLHPNVKEI